MEKFVLKVIFGEDQSRKILNGEPLDLDEIMINVKEYSFKTIEEKNAFAFGLSEAVGWLGYCIPEYEIINYSNEKP